MLLSALTMMKDTAKILLILQLSVRIGEYNIKSICATANFCSHGSAFKEDNLLVTITCFSFKKIESVLFDLNITFVYNYRFTLNSLMQQL